MSPGQALRLLGVTVVAGKTSILSDVSLVLDRGRPTVLLGPNGSGKTTLLKVAMGLVAPTRGGVLMPGNREVPRLAIVLQRPVMLRRTVSANIAFALNVAGRRTDAAEIARLLDIVGLGHLVERPARRLSGGEQQRLALARALARNPELLFLDEPTASLDPAQTKVVEDIVENIAGMGVKIVMATHDIGQARRLAGGVVLMVAGRIVEHTPADQFFASPMSEEGRRFLAGDLVL